MKKYGKIGIVITCLVVSFLIFSCGSKSKENSKVDDLDVGENIESVKEEKIYKIMDDFDEVLKKKNTFELIDYVDKNIEIVGKENADILIYGLETRLIDNRASNYKDLVDLDKGQELLAIFGEARLLSEDRFKEIKNKELKDKLDSLSREKYILVKNGDTMDLLINYDKFLSYNDFVSESAKGYINIEAKRLEIPTLYEGEFNIEIESLGDRLLKYEDYIVEYPESKHLEKILIYYRTDLISYLKGTETLPVVDKNGKTNTKLFNSYKNLIKNKDSITANVVRKYVDNLKNGSYGNKDDLEIGILSLVNQALNFIEGKIE